MLKILEPVVFQPTVVEKDGKAIGTALNYRTNAYDRNPRVVTLTVRKPLAGYDRLPFSYQYTEPTRERRWAEILIVAGPGVSITLKNFPSNYVASEVLPIVEIIRVQDPRSVPPLAADFQSADFVSSFEVNQDPSGIVLSGVQATPPDNYFQVSRLASGLSVQHPFGGTTLTVSVPEFSSDGAGLDGEARFAYYFNPDGKLGYASQPLLTIVKTPAVTLGVSDTTFMDMLTASLSGRAYNFRKSFIPWKLYEVDRIDDIPLQGTPIVPNSAWKEITSVNREPPVSETLAETAFDVIVGSAPVIGNALCLAEFVYGLYSGHDKWGRKLGPGDLALLGVGALLPFMARLRPISLIAKFGSRMRNARALALDLKAARLTSDEARLVQQAVELIQKGERPTEAAYTAASKLLSRLETQAAPVEDILNADRSGFAHAELQEYFEAYQARTKRAVSPEEWIRVTQSKRADQILTGLLGKDYARKSATAISRRVMNTLEIPRSPAMTDAAAKGLLERLGKSRKQLLERMDAFLEELRGADETTRQALLRKIPAGNFNILKGNIGEILSKELQLSILADVAKKYPDAKIIRGIKVQLASGGKLGQELLFSDNIIAVQRGGHLQILGVMEVKAGYKGHAEATAQVFDWLEKRLDEGSRLVISEGATTIAADGTETFAKRASFVYAPGSDQAGQVKLLFRADRHVFIADGVSHVGVESGLRVAPNVRTHNLGTSSADIDWLVGQVITGLPGQL
jgi:hypothetical protein